MRYKNLGNMEERVSEIGIGTWKMGYKTNEEVLAIREGIKLGMSLIDTAEMYANEELVGKAIEGTNAFVATKVSPHNFKYEDVISACDASLKRLRIKQIDLYQLHWPNNKVPIKETISAMEHLVDSGKIRYIGVSNFSVKELREAQAALKKYQIVSNQVEYSVLVRYIDDELLEYCNKNKITIMAYSPMARGLIFRKDTELYSVLSEIAERRQKTIAQVALNWLISKNGVIAIPKSSNIEHMRENAGASDWDLDQEELKMIVESAGASKKSLSESFKTVISNHSFISRAYSNITRFRGWRAQRKNKTTLKR